MMSTNYIKSDYDYNWRNYSHVTPINTGLITNRTKHGSYSITEKDYGDHKVLYHIPSSYENNYDLSRLNEKPFYEEQQKYYSPVLPRRRYYQSYDDDDDSEELPIISPHRRIYASPRRPQVIKRIYYEQPPSPPPSETIEYIYADDYRPKNEEIIEYVVRDRAPRQRYVEESRPIRRPAYVENLPPISRSPRPSSSLRSIKSLHINELSSPRRSNLKPQTPRITPRKSILKKIMNKNI